MTALPATTVNLAPLSQLRAACVFAVNYSHGDHDRSAGTAQWVAAILALALWAQINLHIALASWACCCTKRTRRRRHYLGHGCPDQSIYRVHHHVVAGVGMLALRT
jgi:hypothetical protein